ncbi:MAG: acetate kinase [Coriobacteriales bacterium]|jgi:acetate kinase|nr:acetate kinase [Coriobacteriales bacterium]
MYVLVINAGSSSLKYQLLDAETLSVVDKGLCEKLGLPDSFYHHGLGDAEQIESLPLADHHAAIQAVLDHLLDPLSGTLASLDEIAAVGHRVVHGGEHFYQSTIIDDEVLAQIRECVPLAPLHNPPALTGIEASKALIPTALQVAVFDTAFHHTMPPKAFMYALPYEMYEQHRIRKYGFHGTSHRYVARRAAHILKRPLEDMRIVTCHLGNGGSIAAVDHGRSVDTSMGFTPLDGLMMGTRCGSIDPAIVTYLILELGLSAEDVDQMMNRRSGLFGISGISNDIRDIDEAAKSGDTRAQLALEMYAYSVRKFLGKSVFAMGGLDAIVMTAGVGEHSSAIREKIFVGLEGLGIVLDVKRNVEGGTERVISADDSPVTLLLVPTNEELMIARDTIELYEASRTSGDRSDT